MGLLGPNPLPCRWVPLNGPRAAHRCFAGAPTPADTNTASRSLLFTVAVGKQCAAGSKDVELLPEERLQPVRHSAGSVLSITGSLSVYTNAKQQILIDVQRRSGPGLPGDRRARDRDRLGIRRG